MRLAAVPACPAQPELKQRTCYIFYYEITTILLLHFSWVLVLHCVIFLLVLCEDDLLFSVYFPFLLLRGIVTRLGPAGWIRDFCCDVITWIMGGSAAGGNK